MTHISSLEHCAVQTPMIRHAMAAGWDLRSSREKKNA